MFLLALVMIQDSVIQLGTKSSNAFAVIRKTKANFPFGCDSFRRRLAHIPKLFSSCLGTIKMAAYANKVYVCLFITKNMAMFIALILFIVSV